MAADMKVRVKSTATMFAESTTAPPSQHCGKVGTTVPAKIDEYDVGVLWNEYDDPNWPCHFMWHELEVLD